MLRAEIWDNDELITIFVQEEGRMVCNRAESAHMSIAPQNKKRNNKS